MGKLAEYLADVRQVEVRVSNMGYACVAQLLVCRFARCLWRVQKRQWLLARVRLVWLS